MKAYIAYFASTCVKGEAIDWSLNFPSQVLLWHVKKAKSPELKEIPRFTRVLMAFGRLGLKIYRPFLAVLISSMS